MSITAKRTMLLYAALSAAEEKKLERLDGAVFSILIEVGNTYRHVWTSSTDENGRRVVQLRGFNGTTPFTIDAEELSRVSDDEMLARVRRAVAA